MDRQHVDKFEKANTQVASLHQELTQLAKKSPDNPVNKFKLKLINAVLQGANEVLGTSYNPLEGFVGFNEDDMPTTSDVTLVLGQYLNCMEKLRADNIHATHGQWVWRIDNSDENIRTAPPNKIARKK